MDCEVLLSDDVSQRATRMFKALIDAAPEVGVNVFVTEKWTKKHPVLMSYGLGHPTRKLWTEAHVRNGGRLIGWDLAYWDRDNAMRTTVDHLHPQKHLRDMPPDRWTASGIELRNDSDPSGPILLVGMGRKSRAQFAMQDRAWERQALKDIRATYQKAEILYRPKRPEDAMPGCRTSTGTIEEALKGTSLVVCRHSNVAVDACVAGVPVVCEDGAASALYGRDMENPINPDPSQRLRFLQNLAWWQYQPKEAVTAWKFLLTVLG